MDRNGLLQHQQVPGTPLASKAGAEAGLGSVIAQAVTWRQWNPWVNAPIHLMSMLNPYEVAYGGYELNTRRGNWNCLGPDPREGVQTFQPRDSSPGRRRAMCRLSSSPSRPPKAPRRTMVAAKHPPIHS